MSSNNKTIVGKMEKGGFIKKMTPAQKEAFMRGQKVSVPLDKRHNIHYHKVRGHTTIGLDAFKPYERKNLDFMRRSYRGEATQSVYAVQALHHGLMKNVVLKELNLAALGLYKIQSENFIQSTRTGMTPNSDLNMKSFKQQMSFYIHLMNDNEEKAKKALEKTQSTMVDMMVAFEEEPDKWGISDTADHSLEEHLKRTDEDMSLENNYIKACNLMKQQIAEMKQVFDKFFGKMALQLAKILGDRTGELTMTHPFNNKELVIKVERKGEIALKHDMLEWSWWKRLDTFKGVERFQKFIWQHYNWDIIKQNMLAHVNHPDATDEDREECNKIIKEFKPNNLEDELSVMNKFTQMIMKGYLKVNRGEYDNITAAPAWVKTLMENYRELESAWFMWYAMYVDKVLLEEGWEKTAKKFKEEWGMPGCRAHLLGEVEFPENWFHEL